MTTETAINEYNIYLQKILDDHSTKLTGKLDSNQRTQILNSFFPDYDKKSTSEGTRLMSKIVLQSDKNVFLIESTKSTSLYNLKFKNLVRDY